MNRIHDSFINGIISQNKYNNYMIELDNILDKYNEIDLPITIISYKKINQQGIIESYENLKKEIIDISKNCGLQTINDIIILFANLNILLSPKMNTYFKLYKFFNNTFIPTSVDIYKYKEKKYIHISNTYIHVSNTHMYG